MKNALMNISDESLLELENTVRNELMSIEDIQEILKEGKYGPNSLVALKIVLDYDPMLRGAIRRNELTGQMDIVAPVPWKRRGIHVTDTDINNIAIYMEENYKLGSKYLEKVMDVVANENGFHPIRDYLNGLVWDGVPRIANALHHFLGAEQDEYTAEVMKMHMMGAIHRIFQPGCKYDIMLCIVGGQGIGKSTFFRYLAIKDEWFSDDLKSLDDKRVFEYLQGHWIIEMAEMHAVTTGKSIESTKSFITRTKDTYRVPYEKRAEDRERQCVFCGTSNDLAFLPFDRTGNRRFAPVQADEKRAEVLIFDDEKGSREYIEQMWAEAMEIYCKGDYSLTFNRDMEEYVKQLQKDFMPEDGEVGMVRQFLEDYKDDYVCSAIIYQNVMNGTGIPPLWMSKKIGEIMDVEIEGWTRYKSNHRFGKLGSQKCWKRDEPKLDKDGFMKMDEQMVLPFD